MWERVKQGRVFLKIPGSDFVVHRGQPGSVLVGLVLMENVLHTMYKLHRNQVDYAVHREPPENVHLGCPLMENDFDTVHKLHLN